MKKSLYTIYDSVADMFTKVIDDINDETAKRAFIAGMQDNPHKNDYALYRLATFNDSNGIIEPEKEPVRILTGLDLKDNVVGLSESLKEQNA